MNRSTLCYVTDRRGLPGGENGLPAAIAKAAAAGVDWIQIREKDLAAGRLAALARDAMGAAAVTAGPASTRILINDRLDVALATRAGGVHLGENGLPAEDVVHWLRSSSVPGRSANGQALAAPGFLVGVSCHSLAAGRAAEQAGASYIFFGPVFATPSKAAFGAPQGLERLGEVCRAVKIPVLAIGGITLENAAACLSAGAAGLAAIRLFQETRDLAEVVAQLRGVQTSHRGN